MPRATEVAPSTAPSESDQNVLEVSAVTKSFNDGEVMAVDSVSMAVAEGQLVTLLGPSGCGKTTLLRIIAGFVKPDRGRVMLRGQDITNDPPNRRPISMVFQNYALFPHLTVGENVAYGLRVQGLPRDVIRTRVSEAMSLVDLPSIGERRVDELSGGQQQRVALARAFVTQPDMLLFDEPLSNLDARLRRNVRADLRALQQRLGIASVYVTHDQEEAMAISDQIVILNSGSITQVGDPRSVYEYPTSPYSAEFMGRANWIEASVVRPYTAGAHTVRVDVLGVEVDAAVTSETPALQAGTSITVMARPHALSVTKSGAMWNGKVEQATYVGGVVQYELAVSGNSWMIYDEVTRAGAFWRAGSDVGVRATEDAFLAMYQSETGE